MQGNDKVHSNEERILNNIYLQYNNGKNNDGNGRKK